MTITRRNVLLGATAVAALAPIAARAETSEVLIGVIYPFSGASAQQGIDAQKAYETAAEIINNNYDFDLPLAKDAGLPGLGGAKIKLVFADHQADPQKGRAETERLITQDKVCAVIGTYQSAVAVTVSQVCERYQIPFISADNSSPSLHRRGLKYYFRAAPHDEMFSAAMFDFFDAHEEEGHQDRDAVAVPRRHHLRHRLRQRPAQARGRSRLQGRWPTSNIAPIRRRCRPKCSSSRPPMPTC